MSISHFDPLRTIGPIRFFCGAIPSKHPKSEGRMRRREFILGLAILSKVGRASAQDRVRRVGALITEPSAGDVLEASLREKGWVIGRNLRIEYRITRGDTNLSQAYARELLALKPEVLFAITNTSMAALHAEHSNVPTVFSMVSDPIGMHYVESFSRPGGNVTGFTPFEPSLGGKWVSLIKEVAPNVEHLGIVYNPEPGNNSSAFRKSIDEVANEVGIASIETPSGGSSDIDRLIRSLKNEPNSGLVFLPDAITAARRVEITALVAQCRLPAIYPFRSFCEVGGLMSYGVKTDKLLADAASYVDRILRGANPAELPVQAPTEFEFVVNQKHARQLGVQLPPTVPGSEMRAPTRRTRS
jgi:putative tryptophan/tyrosine transport system substrate-binding protein